MQEGPAKSYQRQAKPRVKQARRQCRLHSVHQSLNFTLAYKWDCCALRY